MFISITRIAEKYPNGNLRLFKDSIFVNITQIVRITPYEDIKAEAKSSIWMTDGVKIISGMTPGELLFKIEGK